MAKTRAVTKKSDTLYSFATGFCVSQLMLVAVKLKVADAVSEGPQTVERIAQRVGAHAPSLRRILRALASFGVFAEGRSGRFRLTPLASGLRSDSGAMDRNQLLGCDLFYHAFGALEHTAVTGAPAFEHVHKAPVFEYFKQNPEKGRDFAELMSAMSAQEASVLARSYPFGEFSRIVDVGGSHGHLLAAILRRHRKPQGVLFDLPSIVAGARDSGFVAAPDVRERCEIVGGDFFAAVPAGADAYILKQIIHDWGDDQSVQILKNCRDAAARGARILIIDHVLKPGNAADRGKLVDVMMMTLTSGGQERSRKEFVALLKRAGLRLRRVISTDCPFSILEAVRIERVPSRLQPRPNQRPTILRLGVSIHTESPAPAGPIAAALPSRRAPRAAPRRLVLKRREPHHTRGTRPEPK
jgi:hypothetical protein